MSHISKNILKNISIDCVVFGFQKDKFEVILIKRKRNPEKNKWALPGGFVLKNETIEQAAQRILKETSNVKNIYLEEVHSFSEVNRFPLRRVITIAYFALINPEKHLIRPGIDTSDVRWVNIEEVKKLPFDHNKIFTSSLNQLRKRIRLEPIGFELLPQKFSLTELQNLYEIILNEKLDKRNFRKKILSQGLLIELNEYQKEVAHRAAKLYKFNSNAYAKLKKRGFTFQL